MYMGSWMEIFVKWLLQVIRKCIQKLHKIDGKKVRFVFVLPDDSLCRKICDENEKY